MDNLCTLHQNKDEFLAVIRETAKSYGIGESMIEKDYWVTWCINYLYSHPMWEGHLGFKGGTCMAKVHDAIERFSEDVDVLLDWRLLGYGKDEPLLPTTKNKQDDMKKDMNKRTYSYLKDTMLPVLQEDVHKLLGAEFSVDFVDERGIASLMFRYPHLFGEGASALLDGVKLEISPMSQWAQLSYKPIVSMMDNLFDGVEVFPPINVLSVSVERTFWDKISILQNISHSRDGGADKPLAPRQSRHYFDVYCILTGGYEKECVEQSQLLFDTIEFSQRFYPVKSYAPTEVELSNLQLSIPDSLLPEITADYERMKDMLFGDKPSFEEIYSTVLKFQDNINEYGRSGIYQISVNLADNVSNCYERSALLEQSKAHGDKNKAEIDSARAKDADGLLKHP